MKRVFLGLVVLVAGASLHAEPTWQDLPRLVSLKVRTAPAVDGEGSEDAWLDAPRIRIGESPTLAVQSVHTGDRFFLRVAWEDEKEDGPGSAAIDTILFAFGRPGPGPPFEAYGLRAWTAGTAASPGIQARRTQKGWEVEMERPLAAAGPTDLALDLKTGPLWTKADSVTWFDDLGAFELY